MALFILSNDFHNTTTTVRAHSGDPLSKRQITRTRSTLCPSRDCTCGGALGERGPQSVLVEYVNNDGDIALYPSTDAESAKNT